MTPQEREIVLTIADDEKSWHVFTDSRRALSSRLVKVANAIGAEVTPCGQGVEFALPLNAVSVRMPRKRERTEAQKAASAAAAQRLATARRSRVLTP